MDILNLENSTQNIQVRNMVNEDVEVINHSSRQLIGKGRQGAKDIGSRHIDDLQFAI
jgi:hypothetical protein